MAITERERAKGVQESNKGPKPAGEALDSLAASTKGDGRCARSSLQVGRHPTT